MKLDPRKSISPKIEEAVANVINMKMKNSSLPNNSIQLNTGGSQHLTPISVARKDSDVIAKRTLRARTKQSKDLLQMISGKSEETTAMQTSHLVQSFDVIEGFKSTVGVPADHVAATKSTLNLPWNLLRDVRRWLHTFNINLAPDGNCIAVVKDWLADSIRSEEIPALVIRANKTSIELRPWSYYNLVAYVLRYPLSFTHPVMLILILKK